MLYARYQPIALGGGGTGVGGVTSLNGEVGAITLVPGTGISITPSGTTITITNTAPSTGGTVTSVALADGSTTPIYAVSGSPVTTAGTLTFTLSSQAQNSFFAGPTTGSGQPAFRAIVAGDLPNLSGTYVPQSEVGAANGVASLDSSGKVPVGQLPSVVMEYEGAWNPNTNTPTLSDGTGTNGNVYYVTAQRTAAVAGNTDPSMVNFQIGDLVIYSATVGKWQLVTPAAGVSSVNGAQGAVTVNAINQLTGDGTAGPASGSASAALTLASVNSNIGSFTNASITVNAKGLITAASSGAASGTVTSVSVTSANGFAGTVATPTTTPAITLSTTLTTPVIAGNGTALIAATTTGTGSTVVLQTSPTINGAAINGSGTTIQTFANFVDTSDATKTLQFSTSGSATGTRLTVATQQTASEILQIPNITATDTLATLGLAQTFSGANTFSHTGTALTVTNGATVGTLTLTNALTVPNGGTGVQSIPAYAVVVGGTTTTGAIQTPVAGTTGQVLTYQGTSALPTWTTASTGTVTSVALSAPSVFTVSGSPVTSSGTLALSYSGTALPVANGGTGQTGALNANGVVYASSTTAMATTTVGTAGQVLTSNGTGVAPTFQSPSSSLVAPTIQKFLSGSSTYTTPTSPRTPLYIRVTMVGGGGGGSGSGTGGASNGGDGGTTTFGTSLLVANGGSHGAFGGSGGTGGTASLGSGPIGIALTGGQAQEGGNNVGLSQPGAQGAVTPFGGEGAGANGTSGGAGITNTGSGGGGGGAGAVPSVLVGSGGGAGGYVDVIITSPTTTYSYAVGAGGTAGTAGTNGFGGGAGGSGIILVTEYYQ